MKQIQILPLKDGKQVIYSGITLAGEYIPDPEDSRSYELPAGVFDLVPAIIKTSTTYVVDTDSFKKIIGLKSE